MRKREKFLLAFESLLCRGEQATLPDNTASAFTSCFFQVYTSVKGESLEYLKLFSEVCILPWLDTIF